MVCCIDFSMMYATGHIHCGGKKNNSAEKQWMLIPKFKVVVFCNIVGIFLFHKCRSALDMWQIVMAQLRKFLRGYGSNIRGDQRRRKVGLLEKLKSLDEKVENDGLPESEWIKIFVVKEELVQVYKLEEKYWQRRSGVKWILEGDANI
jgi:hypothetical protein